MKQYTMLTCALSVLVLLGSCDVQKQFTFETLTLGMPADGIRAAYEEGRLAYDTETGRTTFWDGISGEIMYYFDDDYELTEITISVIDLDFDSLCRELEERYPVTLYSSGSSAAGYVAEYHAYGNTQITVLDGVWVGMRIEQWPWIP